MGRKKKGADAQTTALAEMTREQLIELAVEKGVAIEADAEKEAIIQSIIEADPSLAATDEGGDSDSGSDNGESGNSNIGEPDFKVGTIRTIKGVEMVKINDSAEGWVPAIRENIEDGKPVAIVCRKRAGRTIFAKTGKPITFDADGRAVVSAVDSHYLANIIINGKPEYTVE